MPPLRPGADVLVLRPGALGDTLLAVPALRALRAELRAMWGGAAGAPGGRLILAGHAGAARLLAGLGEVDAWLAFDDSSLAWLFTGQVPPSFAAVQVVAWMSAGSAPGLRQAALVAPGRPPPGMVQHVASYLLETLNGLRGGFSGVGPQRTADAAGLDVRPLAVTPLPSEEVLVHPGSGSAAKNWPAARVARTIELLAAATPVRLIVGEADAAAAAQVDAALGRRLPRLDNATLEELASRLAGCRAYLGNDSGVSHLAGLCGARTVVLFGPTSPNLWRPLGRRVVTRPFEASPESVAAALQS